MGHRPGKSRLLLYNVEGAPELEGSVEGTLRGSPACGAAMLAQVICTFNALVGPNSHLAKSLYLLHCLVLAWSYDVPCVACKQGYAKQV